MVEAYCVKCKKKGQKMKEAVMTQTAKGGFMAKGKCPDCGTIMCAMMSAEKAEKAIKDGKAKKRLLKMFVNVIKSYRDVVAICDKELIGKKFEEGNFQLDVKENFFKGREASTEEVSKIMKEMKLEDSTFNIVGEKSIKIALETGIITKQGIRKIDGIPLH